jgi:CHAT domain-containing protein
VLKSKRLLISPEGPLWQVPFAALVLNAQGPPRYLGAEKPITYTQSLTLFAQAHTDRPHLARGVKPVALVVGNPLFDRIGRQIASAAATEPRAHSERAFLWNRDEPPAPLPATGREAMAVARLYDSAPLLGARATEAAVRRQIGQADVIHLATHGYLHPYRAMSSGVLLTPPASEPAMGETKDDGALQAWEIYSQLKLKAELVVLSACETGRGENVQGEGIVGLTRALQYAGTRSIVASLWPVADESTATLMVAFHQKLRQGLTKDEALRQAMTLVRRNPETAHPYYWAAFFLTGDPENPTLGVGQARP